MDRPAPHCVVGDSPSIFSALADPSVRLVIWRRPNPCQPEGYPPFARPARDELTCLPDWLGRDILLLGGLYQALADRDWQVRLEAAEGRTCPAFHEDAVRLRLLVTYRGPGTEWTTGPDNAPVREVPPGAVAAFKGRAWPSSARLLHRSAKASVRRPRWLLAMDAAAPAGPETGAARSLIG
ncbi:MAG: DUF1826 domain-containing protein [Caulobacteraceae bacterium]|nr:DUF1826 domain-containing protein [Caulobacteraceae bacterium]